MSEVKHTPTPWRWETAATCWLVGADGATILHVDPFGNTIPSEAEANLIVTAVNSYKELTDAIRCLIHSCEAEAKLPEWLGEQVVLVKAALAKAGRP